MDDTTWLTIVDPDGRAAGAGAARLEWEQMKSGVIASGTTPRSDTASGNDNRPIDGGLYLLTGDATLTDTVDGAGVAYTAGLEGDLLKYSETAGQWELLLGLAGGGTITGVTAGTGLTVTETDGDVTIGIANTGVDTPQLAGSAVTK